MKSKRERKFRVIFLNDVPVTDRLSAEIIIKMLLKIFSQTDKSCKDVSRMFFGGKKLIGNVGKDTINIVGLTESFQRYIFETQQKNYSREIQQFAKENKIACINNCIQIFRICECDNDNEKNEDFSNIAPYIYGSRLEFPSSFPLYVINTHYQPNVRRAFSTSYEILQQDFKTIEQKCCLYHDFVKKPHIHHNERFLLLTNLLHISGGCKRFLSIIEKKDYDRKKRRFSAKYAKDKGYKPQLCEGNCPYTDECHHAANMVNTVRKKERIVKAGEGETYYSVKQLTNYPMSRQCIQTCKKELKVFLVPLSCDYHMITFMKYEDEFGASRLHFGNAEGVDSLNGKNVLLLGTPHLNEFVYKLIGCHLGMDIDSDVLAVRKIQHKEYEFSFIVVRQIRSTHSMQFISFPKSC